MGFRQKIGYILRTIWYVFWTYPIRLYRPIRKLFILLSHLFLPKQWKRQIWEDLFGIILLIADLAAVPEIYDISNLLIKRRTRGLSPKEKGLCSLVLKDSIPTNLIKIDNTALTAKKGKFAYVSFFTINVFGTRPDYKLPDPTFVHELIHVWQYTRFGSEYIARALFAQHSNEGYDYGGATGISQAYIMQKTIMDFNFEQQGEILADYFVNMLEKDKISKSLFFQRDQIYSRFIKEIIQMKIYRL